MLRAEINHLFDGKHVYELHGNKLVVDGKKYLPILPDPQYKYAYRMRKTRIISMYTPDEFFHEMIEWEDGFWSKDPDRFLRKILAWGKDYTPELI